MKNGARFQNKNNRRSERSGLEYHREEPFKNIYEAPRASPLLDINIFGRSANKVSSRQSSYCLARVLPLCWKELYPPVSPSCRLESFDQLLLAVTACIAEFCSQQDVILSYRMVPTRSHSVKLFNLHHPLHFNCDVLGYQPSGPDVRVITELVQLSYSVVLAW